MLNRVDRPGATGFWQHLDRPFWALAPMEDVTDVAFRELIRRLAPPDVFFCEFTAAENVAHRGRASGNRLRYLPGQRPIVAQVWSNDPDAYVVAAARAVDQGFDGLDINMGCPQKKIIKKGHCGGLIRLPELASAIVEAAFTGAAAVAAAGRRPPAISIKTRLSFANPAENPVDEAWIVRLLQHGPAALTVHGRSVADLSAVPADWRSIARVVALRDAISPHTRIIGNGDIVDRRQGVALAAAVGVDGIMVGRGIFHNPFIFRRPGTTGPQHFNELSPDDRLALAVRHVRLYEYLWGKRRNFDAIKKYLKVYLRGTDALEALRAAAMRSRSFSALYAVLADPDCVYTQRASRYTDGHPGSVEEC